MVCLPATVPLSDGPSAFRSAGSGRVTSRGRAPVSAMVCGLSVSMEHMAKKGDKFVVLKASKMQTTLTPAPKAWSTKLLPQLAIQWSPKICWFACVDFLHSCSGNKKRPHPRFRRAAFVFQGVNSRSSHRPFFCDSGGSTPRIISLEAQSYPE